MTAYLTIFLGTQAPFPKWFLYLTKLISLADVWKRFVQKHRQLSFSSRARLWTANKGQVYACSIPFANYIQGLLTVAVNRHRVQAIGSRFCSIRSSRPWRPHLEAITSYHSVIALGCHARSANLADERSLILMMVVVVRVSIAIILAPPFPATSFRLIFVAGSWYLSVAQDRVKELLNIQSSEANAANTARNRSVPRAKTIFS